MGKLSKKGVVISERQSAWAGMEMIKSGGNAVDAAVAAAMAESATAPADNGFGGYGGAMLIYMAKQNNITVIDYNTRAPAGIKIDAIRQLGTVCGNNWRKADEKLLVDYGLNRWDFIGIPGTIAGLAKALKNYGTKSWQDVFKPTLSLVDNGIQVNDTLHDTIKGSEQEIRDNECWSRELLLDGQIPEIGSRLPMRQFVNTLHVLNRKGPEAFYEGSVGEGIIRDIAGNHGAMTMEDLSRFKAQKRSPISTTFMGYDIYTAPPCLGGISVLEFLNIFEALDDQIKADKLHAMLKIYPKIWQDRLSKIGDIDSQAEIQTLLSKEYAAEYAKSLHKGEMTNLFRDTSPGTIHISTADEEGNMVALTQTKGGGVPGKINFSEETGIILNIGLGLFDPRADMPNSMKPWKQPLVNMCPTLVLKNNKPRFTLGSPGGRYIVSIVTQMLLDLLHSGDDINQVVTAPRIHFEDGKTVLVEEGMRNQVSDKGYEVKLVDEIGGPAHIISVSDDGMGGATDFRHDGGAVSFL